MADRLPDAVRRPRAGRSRQGPGLRHEDGGALKAPRPQIAERGVGLFQRVGNGFGLHARLEGQREERLAIRAREIGDRTDGAFFPEIGVGKARDVAHVDAAADDAPALPHGSEGAGHQIADRREYDGRVELDRRLVQ